MEPLILDGVEIRPTLSPEALETRRNLIIATIPRMEAIGKELARRENRKLKPLPIRPAKVFKPVEPRPSRAQAYRWIPVGSWIRWVNRNGLECLTQIVAHIEPGVNVLSLGFDLRRNSGKTPVSIYPRYLLASHLTDSLAAVHYQSTTLFEVHKGLVETLQGEPVHPKRLVPPLKPGKTVKWISRSAGNAIERNGVIRAYVPAGTALIDLGLGEFVNPENGIVNISHRDRYAVKCGRVGLTPRASTIEEQFLGKILPH